MQKVNDELYPLYELKMEAAENFNERVIVHLNRLYEDESKNFLSQWKDQDLYINIMGELKVRMILYKNTEIKCVGNYRELSMDEKIDPYATLDDYDSYFKDFEYVININYDNFNLKIKAKCIAFVSTDDDLNNCLCYYLNGIKIDAREMNGNAPDNQSLFNTLTHSFCENTGFDINVNDFNEIICSINDIYQKLIKQLDISFLNNNKDEFANETSSFNFKPTDEFVNERSSFPPFNFKQEPKLMTSNEYETYSKINFKTKNDNKIVAKEALQEKNYELVKYFLSMGDISENEIKHRILFGDMQFGPHDHYTIHERLLDLQIFNFELEEINKLLLERAVEERNIHAVKYFLTKNIGTNVENIELGTFKLVFKKFDTVNINKIIIDALFHSLFHVIDIQDCVYFLSELNIESDEYFYEKVLFLYNNYKDGNVVIKILEKLKENNKEFLIDISRKYLFYPHPNSLVVTFLICNGFLDSKELSDSLMENRNIFYGDILNLLSDEYGMYYAIYNSDINMFRFYSKRTELTVNHLKIFCDAERKVCKHSIFMEIFNVLSSRFDFHGKAAVFDEAASNDNEYMCIYILENCPGQKTKENLKIGIRNSLIRVVEFYFYNLITTITDDEFYQIPKRKSTSIPKELYKKYIGKTMYELICGQIESLIEAQGRMTDFYYVTEILEIIHRASIIPDEVKFFIEKYENMDRLECESIHREDFDFDNDLHTLLGV
jgi:hypothetical protein